MTSVGALQVLASTSEPCVLSSAPATIALSLLPHIKSLTNKHPRVNLADLSIGLPSISFSAVFLNFENIVGKGQPPVYEVYVGLPSRAKPDEEHRAGALPFYGLGASSIPNWEHDGSGMHLVLDITALFNRLGTRHAWDSSQFLIRLQPRKPMPSTASVCIGRVSLYVDLGGSVES